MYKYLNDNTPLYPLTKVKKVATVRQYAAV